MKKISVIMPVYNSKEYIKEAVQSIINQSYQNWELIVINEFGSDDGSKEIVLEFGDSRITVIDNLKKEGISESLNIGLRLATGDYIARMDADDISGPKRFEKQVDFLERNLDVGLCGIVPEFFGDQKISWDIETNSQKIKHNIFFYTPCVHPSIMFRSEIVTKHNVMYDSSFTATEDYEFFSKVIGICDIANIEDKSLFKYRMHNSNATNNNKNKGIELYSLVMQKTFSKYLKLNFNDEELNLLNSHISTNNSSGFELYDKIVKLDLLLKKIFLACTKNKNFEMDYMFLTLNKRWNELNWSICDNYKNFNNNIINYYIKKSIFIDYKLEKCISKEKTIPDISVVLPVYNSESYILDSIKSILEQTYDNFELLVIVEHNNTDASIDYIKLFKDKRIKVIQNDKNLGLAKTLNLGIKMAKGKYIARIDADDLSDSKRFEKQIKVLEENKDVAVVSSWQRHFGNFGTYIHKSAISSNDMKASLLFTCDVCHSTVMLRKNVIIENNLFYDENMAMEDFDLWNRIIEKFDIICIPEVLGEYRIHENNISHLKYEKLIESEIKIISRSLKKLNILENSYNKKLLIGWENIFNSEPNLIPEKLKLLNRIIYENKKYNYYDQDSLIKVIERRKKWIYGKSENFEIEKVRFELRIKRKIKQIIKPIIYPIYNSLFYRMDKQITYRIEKNNSEIFTNNQDTINQLIDNRMDKQITYRIEKNNSEIFTNNQDTINQLIDNRIEKTIDYKISNKIKELENENKELKDRLILINNSSIFNSNKVQYLCGEKIRVLFLFQVPSFWPSWDTVYNLMKNDKRFEMIFVLLETNKEPSQMNTARNFLDKNNIDFSEYNEELINEFNPHILFMQTPYDDWHRNNNINTETLYKKGIRLVYIPYGIELSVTQESIKLQFRNIFLNYMWKVYTLSEGMKETYYKYNEFLLDNVVSTGHPKFDSIYHKKMTTKHNIKKKYKNIKVILLKLHFKREMKFENNEYKTVTPDLEIYINLLNKLKTYDNVLIIILLHPLFYDFLNETETEKFKSILNSNDNFIEFRDDDYREALYAADIAISDRSGVLFELAALDIPIMYISNINFNEPIVPCLAELVDSFHHGQTTEDILKFINVFLESADEKKAVREKAFKKCIPYFDGQCANRIVDDIYKTIVSEKN